VSKRKERFDSEGKGWKLEDPQIKHFIYNELDHALTFRQLMSEGILSEWPDRKGKWRGYLWGTKYEEKEGTVS